MTRIRSIRFVVYPGSVNRATWAIVHRTEDQRSHTDKRLVWGVATWEDMDRPAGMLSLLQACLDSAFRVTGAPPPEAGREPRGALGGGSHGLRRAMEAASGVSLAGDPLPEDANSG